MLQSGRAGLIQMAPRVLFDPSAREIAVANAFGECVWRLHSVGRQDCRPFTNKVKRDGSSLLLLLPASLRTPTGKRFFFMIWFN